MLTIEGRNVNDTFAEAVDVMRDFGIADDSRNGEVYQVGCPVMTVTSKPTERVLFNQHRDCNPFFHLFECLWMMSGMNDATWLDRFVSDFSSRFAEPDSGEIHGAYGHRWSHHFDIDQIDVAVMKLLKNRNDRRVVIAMWDPVVDLESEDSTFSGDPARDVPCNTHIYPRIVRGRLDLTVCCRSNDVVWGCYGANAVHFSFLQEWMAAGIGVEVGKLYQLSNNWHLYEATVDKFAVDKNWTGRYPGTVPVVTDFGRWRVDLEIFMAGDLEADFHNPWFSNVAVPMWRAHEQWKFAKNRTAARFYAEKILAPDWKMAVHDWMDRRS